MHTRAHVLVENESGYRFCSKLGDIEPTRTWYTTSPWLLERIPSLGEEVRSLERGITQTSIDELGFLCRDLTRALSRSLDERFRDEPYGVKVGQVLLGVVRRDLFPLLYKAFILFRWLKEIASKGGRGFIAGYPSAMAEGYLLGRTDTLYAVLAHRMSLPAGVTVLEHPGPEAANALEEEVKAVGTTSWERRMALLNMSWEMIFFRLWKKVLRFRPLSLPWRRNGIAVTFLKSSEVSEEAFPQLLLKGCTLTRMPYMKVRDAEKLEKDESDLSRSEIGRLLRRVFAETFPDDWKGALDFDSVAEVYTPILAHRILSTRRMARGLGRHFEKLLAGVRAGGDGRLAVFTSAFFTPEERVFYYAFKNHSVPMFVHEHGVTGGLCRMNEDWLDENAMKLSDYTLCGNAVSRDYHQRYFRKLRNLSVGLPETNKVVKWRPIQRNAARRRIGLPLRKRVIVYVANLYFNNFIYSPGAGTDTSYHQLKKTVVYDVLGRIGDPCLLKLYPTHRYADPDPFAHLMPLPANVKVAQFVEYRYLRSVGDVVICDSPQSTLGWVWSARVPLIYLDLPANPLLKPVAEAFDQAIFRVDCAREDWAARVRELLLLPQHELMRRWEEKRGARDCAEEKFILGPAGKTGKRAARVLIDEVMRWHPKGAGDKGTEHHG